MEELHKRMIYLVTIFLLFISLCFNAKMYFAPSPNAMLCSSNHSFNYCKGKEDLFLFDPIYISKKEICEILSIFEDNDPVRPEQQQQRNDSEQISEFATSHFMAHYFNGSAYSCQLKDYEKLKSNIDCANFRSIITQLCSFSLK